MSRGPLLAPGYRTVVARDWRGGVTATASVVAGDPGAWVLGLLGFLARGGAVLVVLPILSVPSPVLLSLLFRGEVGVVGRDEVRFVAIGVGIVLSLIAIGGVVVSAWADVALAERFVRDAETDELRLGRPPRRLEPAARRSLVWWVASIQAIATVPVILAITLVIDGAVRAATAELTNPSATDLPLLVRVLPAVAGPALLLIGVLVVVEALSSVASRRLMAGAWGLLPDGPAGPSETRLALGALRRVTLGPGRVLATAGVGWLVIGATVALVAFASALAWGTARDVLVAGSSAGDASVLLASALIVGLFAAVWMGGLGLIGFASALRSGLWTADALR